MNRSWNLLSAFLVLTNRRQRGQAARVRPLPRCSPPTRATVQVPSQLPCFSGLAQELIDLSALDWLVNHLALLSSAEVAREYTCLEGILPMNVDG